MRFGDHRKRKKGQVMIKGTLELMACLLIFVATIGLIIGACCLVEYLICRLSKNENRPEVVPPSPEPKPVVPYSLWVGVDDWGNNRKLLVEFGRVGLQVTLSCGSCDKCSSRVNQLCDALERKSYTGYQWIEVKGEKWLFLSLRDEQEPISHLESVLGITVRR